MNRLEQLFDSHTDFTQMRGTYVFPLRVFADRRVNDPEAYLEVIRQIDVPPFHVWITRGGGLYVHDLITSKSNALEDYSERVAQCFNKLLCELTLCGFFTEPISAVHIQPAKMLNGLATVFGGGGGHTYFGERGMGPLMLLMAPPYRGMWVPHFYWNYFASPEVLLDRAAPLTHTTLLAQVAESVPSLVVGAYYYYLRRQEAETVITAWMVTEQILNTWWDRYTDALADSDRRKRLEDQRSFTANIRAEVLLTAGILPEPLYLQIQTARKCRNDLAHRVKSDLAAATHSIGAMRSAIMKLCGATIAEPTVWRGVAGNVPRPTLRSP